MSMSVGGLFYSADGLCCVEYFVSMSEALEIPERMETLNRKIDYASEVRITPVF